MSAPPFEFLARAFLPLIRRIGFDVHADLRRLGFYPAGGGEIGVTIGAPTPFAPLMTEERGVLLSRTAEAVVSNLPFHIVERELAHLARAHGWPEDTLLLRTVKRSQGPDDCVLLTMAVAAGAHFLTGKPSMHTLTNIEVIQRFLGNAIDAVECGPVWAVAVKQNP